MRTSDTMTREEAREAMQQAIRDNDTDKFQSAFEQLIECIGEDVRQETEEQMDELRQDMDGRVLANRGARQLTSKERKYYQKLGDAMKDKNPKQALDNLSVVMPQTVIDSVFEDLRANHPLLEKIRFIPTGASIKMVMNTDGYQEAAWGELCDEIIKELTSGFKEVETGLFKLSAFMVICKPMLDLGPEWLDRYIHEVLYEALSNGLEAGIVAGTGNKQPIGMTRQVGDDVVVTGNNYPEKAKITISDLSPATMGKLMAIMAKSPNGKSRLVSDLIFVVNPQDYFEKVMPSTTLMAPDGSYRNDVFPYPMTVIPSHALKRGEAVLGIAPRYFAAAGMASSGNIEYSDHYRFAEDQRMYIVKTYANGMPMDNNAFLFLDISELKPATWKVEMVTPSDPSSTAELSDLKLGSVSLEPNFTSSGTSYTADTSNARNTITAYPADAGASIKVTVNDTEVDNGTSVVWKNGSNAVTVDVTAADGTTKKKYQVTVYKD